MNTVSIIICIALLLLSAGCIYTIIKNKKSIGGCSGCTGNCSNCTANLKNYQKSIDK